MLKQSFCNLSLTNLFKIIFFKTKLLKTNHIIKKIKRNSTEHHKNQINFRRPNTIIILKYNQTINYHLKLLACYKAVKSLLNLYNNR